jgi:hypothetical protein
MALTLDSHQWIVGDFMFHLTLSLFEASLSLSLLHFFKRIFATWQFFFQKMKNPPKNDLKRFLGIFWK